MRYLLLYLLLLPCLGYGQNDTTYYNGAWRKTTSAEAKHFCTFTRESNNQYLAKCYYSKTRTIALKGHSTSGDSLMKNGHMEYFDEDGNKSYDAYYENDEPIGTWKYYYDGTDKTWYTEKYKNGKHIELVSYYKSGELKRQEYFKRDDPANTTGKCFDKTGKEIDFTPFEIMPHQDFDMQQHLRDNLHYPKDARKNGIEGRAVVRFIVDTNGMVTDVEVVKHVCPSIDAESARVVSIMPKWSPGVQDDKKVKVYFNIPITFTLE